MAGPRWDQVLCYGLTFLLALVCMADSKPSKLRRLVKRQAIPQIQCPGYTQLVQDSSDCSAYFECNNNFVSRRFCPQGQVFSPDSGQCGNFAIPLGCTPSRGQGIFGSNPSSVSYQCPRANGRFQDTADCSRYYLCTNNQPQSQQCPVGQMFDPNAELCSNLHDPEGCHMPDSSPSQPFTPITGGGQGDYQCQASHGTFHDTTDCSRYYVCSHWQPVRRQCPSHQLFDPVTQICSNTARPIGCHMVGLQGQGSALFTCPSAYGSYQDTRDCSRYWNCYNNQATSTACPLGQLFDTSTSQCSSITSVFGCTMPTGWIPPTTGTVLFTCPSAYGSYQDTRDCSRYWNCYNNQATSTACPLGQLFDTSTSQCNSITSVFGCTMPTGWIPPTTGTVSFTCPSAYGSYQDTSDCSRYWNCYNNQATSTACPLGQLFDTSTSQCNSITSVFGCTMPPGWIPPTTGTVSFSCPQASGEYQYADDCSQYWRCDNYEPVLRRCPGTLIFNAARGFCDWPSTVGTNPQGCRLVSTPALLPPAGSGTGEALCPRKEQATNVPHPRLCNAFYVCGDGRVHRPCIFCGDGTYFDPLSMVCLPEGSADLTRVCPGKVMMPHDNKTQTQFAGC